MKLVHIILLGSLLFACKTAPIAEARDIEFENKIQKEKIKNDPNIPEATKKQLLDYLDKNSEKAKALGEQAAEDRDSAEKNANAAGKWHLTLWILAVGAIGAGVFGYFKLRK